MFFLPQNEVLCFFLLFTLLAFRIEWNHCLFIFTFILWLNTNHEIVIRVVVVVCFNLRKMNLSSNRRSVENFWFFDDLKKVKLISIIIYSSFKWNLHLFIHIDVFASLSLNSLYYQFFLLLFKDWLNNDLIWFLSWIIWMTSLRIMTVIFKNN